MPYLEAGTPDAPPPREQGLITYIKHATLVDVLTTYSAQFRMVHKCNPDIIHVSNRSRAALLTALIKDGAPYSIADANPLFLALNGTVIPVIFTHALKDDIYMILTNKQREINETL